MSEILHDDSESFEEEEEHETSATQMAIKGLSRVVGEGDDGTTAEEDDYYEEDDDYEEDEDDDYYSEEEEEHYGEERTEFDEEKIKLREIPIPKEILKRYPFIAELPHGIAIMGGVARSIAREMITGEREPVRDIDLVNITDEEGDGEVDDETLDTLSREYMPDDYAFGHGIGRDTLKHYFKTRDFTINQVLIMDGKLIVSEFAYNDFQENIIRPTYYEHPYEGDEISSRLFLKALMMRSVLLQISDSIPLIEDMECPEYVGVFNIALFLNKAMSRDARTARLFTEELVDWGIIPEKYVSRPVALAKALLRSVYSFEFRPSTDARFRDIQECRDISGYFIPPSMQRYYASDPVIRRALAEYEDGTDGAAEDDGERDSGRYTESEYDDINRSAYE